MAETSVEMVSLEEGNSEASKPDEETGLLIDDIKSVEATDGQRLMRGVISQGNTETSQNDPERGGVSLDEANSVIEAPNTCRRRSRRVASYLLRLCKLGTAVWMYGDISSDALQTRNYYKKSSVWSTHDNVHWKNGTLQTHCEEMDLDKAYFPIAISVWFHPPLVLLIYICIGLTGKHRKEKLWAMFCDKWFRNDRLLDQKCSDNELCLLCNVILLCIPICIYLLTKFVLMVFAMAIIGLLFCFFMMYVKLPFDALRLALADLGWIPRRWAEWGRIEFIQFSTADMETETKLMKFFELFGEAVPQLALAVTYLANNTCHVLENETLPFLDDYKFPMTIVSIVLSSGSIILGIVNGLLAGRKVIFLRLGKGGSAPIHYAAERGNKNKMMELIKSGADFNFADGEHKTALIVAATNGNLDVAKLLVEAGAGLNFQDEFTYNALNYAADKGYWDIVQLLVEAGADLNIADGRGRTALIVAASDGKLNMAKILVEARAGLNFQDVFGDTALVNAARRGHWDIVNLLVEAGADLNVKNSGGHTALPWVVVRKNTKMAKLLVNAGAQADIKDNSGKTALDYAPSDGVMKEILQGASSVDD